MEDESIYDIKISERGNDYSNSQIPCLISALTPRRINDGEYHIEWNRAGICFKQCPHGSIHHTGNRIEDVVVNAGETVPWHRLTKNKSKNEQFEFENEEFEFKPDSGNPRYNIRVLRRTINEWIEWNTKVPNNINTEVMWQLAQIEEWKWSPQMSQRDIKDALDRLQKCMPKGISAVCDNVRDLVLKSWQKRWEERLSHDILSPNQDLSAAVNSFKRLMYNRSQGSFL